MNPEKLEAIEAFLTKHGLTVEDLNSLLREYQAYSEAVDAITVRLKGRREERGYCVDVVLLDVEKFKPVTSFQMQLALNRDQNETRARLIDVLRGPLTKSSAWGVGHSTRSLRVGGFTSALSAIRESGVLCTLVFDIPDEIELLDFKLFGIHESGPEGVKSGYLNHEPKLLICRPA